MNCHICGNDPGLKPKHQVLWNGFLDKDTDQYVCIFCRPTHYIAKFKNPLTVGLYTEMPVPYKPVL